MRISTTTLESYRLYMQPDQDWMTEDELLATIRGEFVPTRRVLIGSAFGRILETPDPFRVSGGYVVGDVALGDDVMAEPLSLIDRPNTVFEAKATRAYGRHDVVAKADQMVGARIIETKATCSSFDVEKYLHSLQWRFMLDIFGAVSVTYQVSCLYENQNGTLEPRGLEIFTLYPYSTLHADCMWWVRSFVDYVTMKGLAPLLEARQEAAA